MRKTILFLILLSALLCVLGPSLTAATSGWIQTWGKWYHYPDSSIFRCPDNAGDVACAIQGPDTPVPCVQALAGFLFAYGDYYYFEAEEQVDGRILNVEGGSEIMAVPKEVLDPFFAD